MNPIRKRLTYANVMSSLAVFLVLGGATAFAATKIGSSEIKANAVITGKIKKEAVTTAKIKNAAVNGLKLANDAVTTSKLSNDAVTTGKLANDAVGTGKIAPEAVTTGKLATDAVTGAKVAESTLAGVVKSVSYVGKSTTSDSESKNITVDCGPNRKAIGGFYQAFDFGGDVKISVHMMRLATISGEDQRGVEVFAYEAVADPDNWQLSATAVCAEL